MYQITHHQKKIFDSKIYFFISQSLVLREERESFFKTERR
jgi:hypothetical protein